MRALLALRVNMAVETVTMTGRCTSAHSGMLTCRPPSHSRLLPQHCFWQASQQQIVLHAYKGARIVRGHRPMVSYYMVGQLIVQPGSHKGVHSMGHSS